jgi:lipid II:glycine glycyltransferase (peptidoglycan interpeptide bridge formation enzyme)
MAAAVFIHYANELVYLSGGSYEQYLSFGAPYALQWYAQEYALAHRIPRYNFYGTKGTFSGHPDQHGVYRFKKGLGAIVEEQIGYFDMYPRPIFSSLHKILSEKRSRQNATTKPIHTVKSIYGHGSTQQSS